MLAFNLAFKNMFDNKKRTISMFCFVFLVSVISIVCINLLNTLKVNMESSIENCLTGKILLRDSASKGNEIYTINIDELTDESLKPEDSAEALKILNNKFNEDEFTPRIRINGISTCNKHSEVSMIMGIDPKFEGYKNSFILEDGKYLSSNEDHTVVLASALADSLDVKCGDKIKIQTAVNNSFQEVEVKVAGIGDMKNLAVFSLPVLYINLDDAKTLSGYEENEYTDIIIDKSDLKVSSEISNLKDSFKDINNEDVYVENGRSVSGFVLDYMNIFSLVFIILIAVLSCIIGILIINMIVMMGLEKKAEIGTLKAIGFGRNRITLIYFVENMLVSFLSMLAGFIVSFVLIKDIEINDIQGTIKNLLGSSFSASFSFENSLIVIIVITLILGIFSYASCYKITKLNPVDAFKEGC